MSRSRAEELLVESWDRPLTSAERSELETLLAGEADLREDARLWDVLAELEETVEVPSDRLRERFYRALAEAQRESERSSEASAAWWWTHSPSLRLAASVGLVVLGTAIGVAVTGWASARGEAVRLRTELADIRETVVLSLLDHPSASERLRGVSWSRGQGLEAGVVDALVGVASRDESVNVRLAALDVLERHLAERDVRSRLVAELRSQPSAIVQMRLVEMLFGGGDAEDDVLRPLLEPGTLEEVVRERLLELTEEASDEAEGATV